MGYGKADKHREEKIVIIELGLGAIVYNLLCYSRGITLQVIIIIIIIIIIIYLFKNQTTLTLTVN